MAVKRLTTYLGELLPSDYTSAPYDGRRITTLPTNAREVFGKYEATLTHAAYMSRLVYEPNAVIAHGLRLTEYNPVIFNTGLGLLRRQFGRFGATRLSNTVPVPPSIGQGQVIYRKAGLVETPCHLQVVQRNGEKVLYVVFRGTVSLKSGLADVNAGLMSMRRLLETVELGGMAGAAAFAAEIAEGAAGGMVDSFSAHRGFVDNLLPVMGEVCRAIEGILAAEGDVRRIIVTGHSLGGANATLAALVLAGFRRAGVLTPALHCITFGAPKCLTDMTRNVFNSMLDMGALTLDRVAGRTANLLLGAASGGVAMDLVTMIPPHFVHPGYMVLKTEVRTQSRTGRSKQISELREMFAGMDVPGWKEFNSIPTYPEFVAQFENLGMDAALYAEIIRKNWFGTLFSNTGHQDLYAAIKGLVGVQADLEEGEAQQEAAASAADAANVSVRQEGGGKYTDRYKMDTVERGPNHIVYMCHKNISGAACHFGYMGISFNGVIKNLSLSREPFAAFRKEGDMLVYAQAGGHRGGHRSGHRSGKRRTRRTRRSRKAKATASKRR